MRIRAPLLPYLAGLLFSLTAGNAAENGQSPSGERRASGWEYSSTWLRPFWQGDRVEAEPVMFIASSSDATNATPRAQLLFPVQKIVSVQDSARTTTFKEGVDYIWKSGSRELTLPSGSKIPSFTAVDLRRPAGSQKYKLTQRDGNGEVLFGAKDEYANMQVCVTYLHAPESWIEEPAFAGKQLPRTLGKLRAREKLTLVVFGDSISSGLNASGWVGVRPFQPPYGGLLREHLAVTYRTEVALHNPSLDGSSTDWAVRNADKVASVSPDLAIIAFGINDSGSRSTAEYKANIEKLIAAIRKDAPACEFILVATMVGNPDWVRLRQEAFPEFRDALKSLAGPGVAVADMTSQWIAMMQRKNYYDLTGNGVNHPNDFGHRVYAQVLSRLLVTAPR